MSDTEYRPSGIVDSARDIPKAPYYVLSNDSYFSGWGWAEGKTNTVILPCQSWDEAMIVQDNAQRRPEQKYVRVVTHKPRLREHVLYSILDESATAWRTDNRWRR